MKFFLFLFLLTGLAIADPPGHNVHLVFKGEQGTTMWRGGGPRRDTLQALQAAAQQSGRPITLIDLRHPPFADDLRGGGGRLSPTGEEKAARELGLRYRSISALDKNLINVLDDALQQGDVYLHCMYGVNRTGFAVGRYATARDLQVDRKKMGERDWNQGVNFQRTLIRQGAAGATNSN
ncbi:hypothetical protein IV102_12810 [bacterium]|nr:hypothetical protein [bacterium]